MRSTLCRSIALCATAVAALCSAPASAVVFNLTDLGGAGVGTRARAGFEAATYYWSSVLKDDVTVNLSIGFASLGASTIGATGAAAGVFFNTQTYAALAADRTSAIDASAVASLQPLGSSAYGDTALTMTTNALNLTRTGYVDTATRIDDNGSINNVAISANTAVAKALGLTTDANGRALDYAGSDGQVTFNSDFGFDFDPTDGIMAGAFDFIGVAIHEIGHALGFVSGVDVYDMFTGPTGQQNAGALENVVIGSVLDYFRYSADGRLDWSTQNTPYFSIDGGESQMFGNALFSTGPINGDGRQASHWKDSPRGAPQIGILDPTAGTGQMLDVTALDLAAYDAIGWDIGFDVSLQPGYRDTTASIYSRFVQSAVPEPATWAMMIVGLGMVGAAARRRKPRAATLAMA